MKKALLVLLFLITFFSLSAQPPGCTSGTNPVGGAGQQGLYGEYFLGYFNDVPTFFTSTAVTFTRIESTLNYVSNNWSLAVPPFAGSAADQNTFSSRYRGSIYIAASANYTFYLASDDASYLFLDNPAIASPVVIANATINNGGPHGTTTVSATVYLTAGLHNIQILYGENNGGNNLTFQYSSTDLSIAQQIVPASMLCTSVQAALVVPPPPGCTGTDPGGNPAQSGLYAEYYSAYFADVQTYFTSNTPGLVRIDPVLSYTTDNGWGAIFPPASGSLANPETYSVRWRGSIYIATAASYTFYLTGDDACYLWLDAAATALPTTTASATINNGGLHSSTTVSATVALTAGLHELTIHYGENTGNNRLSLQYSSPTIAQQTVPQSILCTSISAVTLPIELLSFNAGVLHDKTVELKWLTATETNNDYFTIERSADGITFSSIASVDGSGTSTQMHSYHSIDSSPLKNISYYRLKQTDFNGKYTYSAVVPVQITSEQIQLSVSPNPSSGEIQISASDNVDMTGERSILLIDMKGVVIWKILFNASAFQEKLFLPKGLYSVLFYGASGEKTIQRIVIE